MAKAYPGTQSIQRALSLLKAFTDEQPEWKLTELAQAVDLNKSTAFRILTALESEELIARDRETDTYRLGPAMITFGGRALRHNRLRDVTRPVLKELAAATNETAALEILIGAEVLIVDEVLGGHVMTGAQSIGTRWPAYTTSTGKAMLAALTAEEVARRLPETLPAWTSRTIRTREALMADLAATRERGYAVADEELEAGLVAVGAPLRNYDGDIIGAISLAGPSLRLTPEQRAAYGRRVQEAARRISTWLGFPPEPHWDLYEAAPLPAGASERRDQSE